MRILPASEFELKREVEYGSPSNETVRRIIEEVRQDGDAALRRMAKEFDQVEVAELRVSDEEIQAAYAQVDAEFLAALRQAAATFVRFMRNRNAHHGWTCSRTAACWVKSSDR